MKIDLKDRPPLKASQKKQLKDLDKLLTLTRARLSFKKISTVRDMLNIYGHRNTVDGFGEAEPLTFQLVDAVHDALWNKLVLSFGEVTQKKESTPIDLILDKTEPLWIDSDSLIESEPPSAPTKKEELDIKESILPPRNPLQIAECYPFQHNAARETFWKLVKLGHRADLCPAKTGHGKTFYAGQLIRWLLDSGYVNDEKSISPYKVLYVTKATIVEQSRDDLRDMFGLREHIDFTITNYEQLRSTLGEMMIEDTIIVEDGVEQHHYKWRPFLHPMIIVWDECHGLKNVDSIQSRIAQAFNNLPENSHTIQIFMSATPFSRVTHAKCFAVATRHKFKGAFGDGVLLTNTEWPRFANRIAGTSSPEDYCKAAIKRLLRELNDYITPFKNVRQKHKAILKTVSIDFETEGERKMYALAWEQYLEAKAKIEGNNLENSRFLILVQFLKFRQAAEMIRCRYVAKLMYESWCKGLAPVYACNFKASIAKTVSYLCQDYNIPRKKISLIWGGDALFGGKEKQFTNEQIQNILSACMRGDEVPLKTLKQIQNQLMAESSGLLELPKELELGAQSKVKRWEEIKNFQSGVSEFCFFSYKSGGAGLSLHQNKEYLRPRIQFNSPTYNEMEMQQAEGRTCRLTSLADVEISTLVYRGTIEVPVMQRVTQKRQCLNIVMGHQGGDTQKMHDDMVTQQEKELEALMHLLDTRSADEKEEERAAQDIYEDEDDDSQDNN